MTDIARMADRIAELEDLVDDLRQQQAETQQERDELPLLYDGRTLEAVLDDWVERLHMASKEDDYKAIADEIDTVAGRLWLYTELRKPAELTIKLQQAEAALSALQASLRSLVEQWRIAAEGDREYGYSAFDECADDLAALVPLPPQEETT